MHMELFIHLCPIKLTSSGSLEYPPNFLATFSEKISNFEFYCTAIISCFLDIFPKISPDSRRNFLSNRPLIPWSWTAKSCNARFYTRDAFLGSVESDLNTNPKCFIVDVEAEFQIAYNSWSSLDTSASTNPGNRAPFRSSAENPREIANLLNCYVASVLAHDTQSLDLEALPMHQLLLICRINAHG